MPAGTQTGVSCPPQEYSIAILLSGQAWHFKKLCFMLARQYMKNLFSRILNNFKRCVGSVLPYYLHI